MVNMNFGSSGRYGTDGYAVFAIFRWKYELFLSLYISISLFFHTLQCFLNVILLDLIIAQIFYDISLA
ncbi:hypothetical protein VNO78_35011 [Psophocarpus tetragonolobus]|uniref:Uncharacterized protein n=1 Tax=Psophocarpus tetragonolobus TaxID=3891 RepID=A0AAN9RM15_PSOTE